MNIFEADEAAGRARSGRQPILKEISVLVVTLESIITNYFPDGLELLSLDTEGLDLALLKSLNYKKHQPLAICVETVGFSENLAKPKTNVITSMLAPHGYALFADAFVNTIYIDTEHTVSKIAM